ncbi:MAG TPA: lipase maturation factor family protein [Candidatus Acidoferrum sp.]|nr:lipase maturation factor family protein [Candidatus Acidoferrum sp.]
MKDWSPASAVRWLFASEGGKADALLPRWMFLRALGLIYYSAFFSLLFQIKGLIGPQGILPAGEYLRAVAEQFGRVGYWYAPTLLWFSSGRHMLTGICWVGMIASVLLVLNLWPRGMLAICFVCLLSFVSAAQDFSGYQSDGMLLEAGFISLFFAPRGLRPRLGEASPPSRASWFLLLWECFRIYFESGVAKIMGGDPEWRNFTALDDYYQNGPLPTWIGWYMQHLPHWFQAAMSFGTLALELVLVWMIFLPRRFRIVCFCILTPWQIGIILSANYTFLNYLVLALGFLLLDDKLLKQFLPERWKRGEGRTASERASSQAEEKPAEFGVALRETLQGKEFVGDQRGKPEEEASSERHWQDTLRKQWAALKLAMTAVMLSWIFYVTAVEMIWMVKPVELPTTPVSVLDPFRIANRYGLFAIMTRGRYEIEFQGSDDGQNWLVYPFRFKPQDPAKAPGIYAPYQPRFDWNLWFASLSTWREEPMIVPRTERGLLRGSADVLQLFAGNPFPKAPPKQVRAVLWQYWFTAPREKRATGMWWRREQLGLYAPTLEREADGRIVVLQWPQMVEPRE